mmetsp:Transcript_42215/g.99085  ORF Transcript_42215/g.99085 Transcript_42215/m.99085 type:complete len:204 (+) Transcript_42215:1879-2490(+)
MLNSVVSSLSSLKAACTDGYTSSNVFRKFLSMLNFTMLSCISFAFFSSACWDRRDPDDFMKDAWSGWTNVSLPRASVFTSEDKAPWIKRITVRPWELSLGSKLLPRGFSSWSSGSFGAVSSGGGGGAADLCCVGWRTRWPEDMCGKAPVADVEASGCGLGTRNFAATSGRGNSLCCRVVRPARPGMKLSLAAVLASACTAGTC